MGYLCIIIHNKILEIMAKEVVFTGTLDECHAFARQNGANISDFSYTPTDGVEWTDDDEWAGGGNSDKFTAVKK